MKKWIARSAFVLLAVGVIALGAVCAHFYQESRDYRENLAQEYKMNWAKLENVTDLAASLYGENLLAYGELDASDVGLHVAMAVQYLYLSPDAEEDLFGMNEMVSKYYNTLVRGLDNPEYAADAMPLFQDINRDLHELSQYMVEHYQEIDHSADMTDPESDAYREAETKIRAFMDEYQEPLSEYFGFDIS